ncbi:MAG: hypothetical protein RIR70_580, partial [Pseudomonadota bacterium]
MQGQPIRLDARHPAAPLNVLLELSRAARAAKSLPELEFLWVNNTHSLAPYRQAALWDAIAGVRALSGVVAPEAHAPYTQWIASLCAHLTIGQRSPAVI